jgi:hypothetical protein
MGKTQRKLNETDHHKKQSKKEFDNVNFFSGTSEQGGTQHNDKTQHITFLKGGKHEFT